MRQGVIGALAGLATTGMIFVALAVGSVTPAGASPVYVSNPASLVNPFIGTSGGGNTFPGGRRPLRHGPVEP